MMFMKMLSVTLGMTMYEYDNGDPACKIDADADADARLECNIDADAGGATDIAITRQSASP